ncbi:MAG: Rieske (2Fe-2S) protein [Acidobacteria bacterium]|nr:Rieske (2Fe-2S) protein [Acidobacteriota bacterium]
MPSSAETPDLDRRTLCACGLALAAGVACGGGGGGGGTTTPPPGGGSTTVTTTDTKAGLLAQPAGTVRDYTSSSSPCPNSVGAAQGYYLARDSGGIFAISASCLHLGGRITPNAGGFSCGCHGSGYDLNGTVTKGPAPVGSVLAHYEVRESTAGGVLLIDTSKTVSASTRLN